MRPCDKFAYDRSLYESTFTSEWDLICDKEYLKSTAQTAFFVGQLLGVCTSGIVSDKYGRKALMVPLAVFQSIAGIATGLIPSIETFMICRFFQGAIAIGIDNTGSFKKLVIN